MRRAIITGRYKPGQPLREETLEAEYCVSRGPIREALRLLELRGLVSHAPRRGFRVRTYSVKDIEDLYRIRALLERHSVECLARANLDALLIQLDASNARMAAHFDQRNIEGYLAENVTFHTLIIDTSGNESLKRTLDVLNEMAEPLRYALLSRNLKKSRSLGDHRRIADLLRGGRIDAAAAATEVHILDNLPAMLALAEKL
ncbi:MAG: GntR family transcriptional regulator [Beijerinckiaceae bacterium]|nr:GntR family transcriptional regulator [Beijerinckiaceae bacterium]